MMMMIDRQTDINILSIISHNDIYFPLCCFFPTPTIASFLYVQRYFLDFLTETLQNVL